MPLNPPPSDDHAPKPPPPPVPKKHDEPELPFSVSHLEVEALRAMLPLDPLPAPEDDDAREPPAPPADQ